MLFSMIAIVGTKTIKDEKVKFNAKNLIIMASILFIGLIAPYINPMLNEHFGFIIGLKITKTVTISGLSFAAIVGVVLNLILNGVGKDTSNKK